MNKELIQNGMKAQEEMEKETQRIQESGMEDVKDVGLEINHETTYT